MTFSMLSRFGHSNSASSAGTISKLFEDAVGECPQDIAVQFEFSKPIAYQEMNYMVEVLVSNLQDLIYKSQLVPVLLPRSSQQICVILALAKLGAVYVPLDAGSPDARLCSIVSSIQAKLIIAERESNGRFKEASGAEHQYFDPLAYLGESMKQREGPSFAVIEKVHPNDLAAVLFTSGSTGQPKGVMLSHRNLIEPVRLLSHMAHINSRSRLLQFASCAFDVHLLDICCAMFNGATLCQVSNDNLTSNLSEWIRMMRVDMVNLTPSVISILECNEKTTLKYMVTSGEPVTQAIIQDWGSKVVLINVYGPCEASSVIAKTLHADSDPGVLGRSTCHASIHLLDDSGRPVAPGTEGEIYCSGDSIALGYLNDDASTKRCFHPASSFVPRLESKGDIVYATGDYGTFTSAGELIFLGRRDSQIKINGQRVDLAEINKVLARFSIRSFVLPVNDPTGRARIYGFVTKTKDYSRHSCILIQDPILAKELYFACRAYLPAYMIPKFIVVSALPLNSSGKVDNQKLSQVAKNYFQTSSNELTNNIMSGSTTTSVDLQGMLATTVAARFSGNTPQIDDDLRCYGLTSLDFMIFLKDLKKKFGVSLSFREVFNNPEIRSIAKILSKRLSLINPVKDYPTDNRQPPVLSAVDPLTEPVLGDNCCWVTPSAGQEMIFAAQSVLRNHAYNCNSVLRVRNFPLDTQKLISALKIVCSRHEVLRSTYHSGSFSSDHDDHYPLLPICRQKIHQKDELGPVCRVNHLDPPSTERKKETVLALIAEDAKLIFDLELDSPVRMTVHQLSASGEDWIIHFNIHHIAVDEWGFRIVCRELERVYQALQIDSCSISSLDEPPQYSQFSRCHQTMEIYHQQHERLKWWLRSIDVETSEPFMSEIHMHRPAKTLTKLENDESFVHIRNLDSKKVRCFEANECLGSTPFIGWLTLCQIVLARMTQKAKFLLAVPVTDRGMDPKFQDIVGFCLNTLLIPVNVISEDSFESSLRSTQRKCDACVANSLPLEMVVEALGKARPAAGKVRPEFMFVYHDSDRPVERSESSLRFLEDAEDIQFTSVASRFDLVVHYSKRYPEIPQLTFEYRQSLFSHEFMEAMSRSFEAALCDVIACGNQKLNSQINCLSAIDETRIFEWSAPPILSESMESTWIRGEGILLHQLVEIMARKVPQATAVVTKSGYALTYAELFKKAQALCGRLQLYGLTQPMTVHIFLTKSAKLVVAELAVLIGGGSLVVLDPQQKIAINQAKIEISCPGIAIVDSITASTWSSLHIGENVQVVNLSESVNVISAQKDVRVSTNGDAYLCFTSGSTGNAKYFPISHAAAAASITSHVERLQLRIGDRVGMVCSTTFDVSMLETFATLAAGATLCIATQDEILTNLAQFLRALEVTHVITTPTLISLLESPAQVPSLRFIALMGEPTTARLFELWVGAVDLRNFYGPAEMTINTHSRRFSVTDDLSRVGQRIGTSMPSVRSYLLDVHGNLTLPGCLGYLHIGAREIGKLSHLSRGYISPISANALYTNHPRFGRLYNTDDLFFYTFDGELNFLGRGDDQIKMHGVRMNLGDIERMIQSKTNQQIAAVVYNISESMVPEQAIILFVHFQTLECVEQVELPCSWLLPLGVEIREILRELRQHAAEKLIDVMVPRFWLPVRTFPRSNNGKVDRKVFQSWAVEFSSHSKKAEYATLSQSGNSMCSTDRIRQTALGQTLVESWKSIFRIADNEIDVNTTFLHVGGDSISAIRYVSSLRSKGVTGCTISKLYDSPTLSLLHDTLKSLQLPHSGTNTHSIEMGPNDIYSMLEPSSDYLHRIRLIELEVGALGISHGMIKRVYPTTSMQRAMLLQTESHSEFYITQVVVDLRGELDTERMTSAWRAVCSAHPTMHTTFVHIMLRNILSFFSVEIDPSTLKPPVIFPSLISSDTFMNKLKTDRERGFEFGSAMFRLLIVRVKEQSHKMVLTCHHASCDGWSLNIILRDLANAYQGYPVRHTPSFSEIVSFDIKRDKMAAKSYWKTYLQDYNHISLAYNDLLASRPTKMMSTKRILNSISAPSLSRFAQKRNITPVVIFQAAWATLLSKATGTDNVAFGVVVSGRNVQVDGAVEITGNFLNTIPLRINLDRNLDCDSWLQKIHQSSIESLEHHHLSLEEIIRQSGNTRIFETVLIFENHADQLDSSAFGSLHLQKIDGQEYSEIPLTLVLEFIECGLMATLKFNNALFPVWQIESIMQHFIAIVSDILAGISITKLGQSEPYNELDFVKDSLARLQKQFQDTHNRTLISLFTQAVQAFPENVAVEEDAGSVTFFELSERSDAVSDFLVQADIRTGHVVPIVFGHSTEMIVAMLGIMKVGAAYCPIDVDAPEGRIRDIIEKTAARLIVVDADNRKKISKVLLAKFEFVCMEEIERARWTSKSNATVCPDVASENPCYVLFTSGSTGRQKGCVLSHSAVVNAVLETSSTTQIDRSSRVLLFAKYIFDASVIDIFGCLFTGATLCLSSRAGMLSNLQLVINKSQISHIHLTPSVAQVLSPDACPSLRTMVLGGERMSSTLRDRWASRVRLYDGYGPTECAVQVSTTLVHPLFAVGVISKPLSGNVIVLLSKQGEISRVGEIGEIHLGGHQLFSGYLGEREATERVLRRSSAIDSLLFATGDLGRYRQDMTIELFGRNDTQVKLSGERLEVEEIESIICSFTPVKRCAVLVERNQLYAMVEERERNSKMTSDQIREWCFGRLPERLVPLVIMWPNLPLTASSKLDRRVIAQNFRNIQRLDVVAVENSFTSETEHSIASMIMEISGHQPKNADRPLHHSGLNSLDILHLRSSMAKRYGFTLDLADFWLAGSIRSLANLVEKNVASQKKGKNEDAPIASSDMLPALISQVAVWVAQNRYSDSTYNVYKILRFQDVDYNHMYTSLKTVIDCFDIFKITFEWNYVTESLQQRLHSESIVFMELHLLRNCEDTPTMVRNICHNDRKTVFDLENGPLARFRVFVLSGKDCYLYYNIHHVLVDEWTCEKFVDALLKQYHGFSWRDTMNPSWDSLTIAQEIKSCKDIALENWKLKLDGATIFDTYGWPRGNADMENRSSASTSKFKVPTTVLRKLQLDMNDNILSFFTILLSTFQVLLHQYTKSQNLIVLIPISRRGFDARTMNSIGNMTYTVAVRSNIEAYDTFLAFGKRTAESVSFARENSVVTIDQILNTISSAVSDHSVMFVYNRESVSQDLTNFSDFSTEMLPQESTMFDITLNVTEEVSGLSIFSTFDAKKFSSGFVEVLVESYLLLLTCLSKEGTGQTLRDLLHLAINGSQNLNISTDDLRPNQQINTLLHEAFEARAIEAPLSVAIEYLANGQRTLVSYAELNNNASKLAAMLQKKYGIVAGDIVPVFIDQTPDLLVAIIGILKAGAGYTPIPQDGTWPLERVRQILRRCQAKVLVSDVSVVPGAGVTILDVHSLLDESNKLVSCKATPKNIAYILWTSGTTGEPKGVMLSHSAVASCIANISGRIYPRSIKDRVFQFASPIFDVSVTDYFTTLSMGATLCMMPRAELLNNIQKAVSELKPTVANLTTSVAQLLDPRAAKLQTLIVSGEIVTSKVRDMFIGARTNLINLYGTAESNNVTFTEMNAADDIRSIGKPFSSEQVIIIDDFGNIAPTFVRGEICIGGSHLFSGYQSCKELTERAHIIIKKYGRLYKSGDIGFLDAAGNIIFCGRRDTQTKLNGQRFEPEGISSVISEIPYIKGNAVAMVEKRLAAFLVYGTSDNLMASTRTVPYKEKDMEDVRNYVRSRVPSAFVPSIWLRISYVPITSSGKLDARKLKALVQNTPADQGDAYVGPENQCEQKIHDFCLQVLGTSISMTANLLDYGLDSYLAMILVSKLRVAFPNFQVSLRTLMENPVLRKLAVLAQYYSTADNMPYSYAQKRALADVKASPRHPSSSMQKRFCLAQDVFQDATYNIPGLFEFQDVGIERVRVVLNSIIAENAIFRTCFEFSSSEGYQQIVIDEFQINVDEHNFALADISKAYVQMQHMLQSELKTPFNIKMLPLIRCKVFNMPNKIMSIFLNFHHSIMDEHSLRLFVTEISSKLFMPMSENPVPRIQYVSYCTEERSKLSNATCFDNSSFFWSKHLEGMDAITLPISPMVQVQDIAIKSITRHWLVSRTAFAWTHSQGMTNFSFYLTSFQILLARCWGLTEPAILIPISQRPTDGEESYGCFLNTVPIHSTIDASSSLDSVMKNSNRLLLDIMEHSFVPYESILEAAGLKSDAFPVMFVYHENKFRQSERFKDISHIVRSLSHNVKPKFPLTFSVTIRREELGHALEVNVDYDTSKISDTAVQSLCDHYEVLLLSVSKTVKNITVAELEILTEAERNLLRKRQDQQTPQNYLPRVYDIIEQRVRVDPERIACWFEADIKTTYRNLWRLIVCISELLLPYYSRKNGRVAIFMEPGYERIASIVGILRAGFAYVPLDIEWPTLRIAAVLQDSAPEIILVSSNRPASYLQILKDAANTNIVISLPSSQSQDEIRPKGLEMPSIDASDLAYILYTSGSTGIPKGVQVEHGALSNSVDEHCRIYHLSASSKLLQVAPWTFDVSVVDIFGTLSRGATLCLGSRDYLLSRLQEVVNLMRITHLATTPTIGTLLSPESSPTLETLAIGGEPMTKAVQEIWSKALRLLNVYGPTEATVNVVYCHVQPTSNVAIIGKPLQNVKVYILNDQLQEVPLDSIGQLAIGGVQLARGYTNKDLDKKSFITHQIFGRIFLTGDLAKFTDDGSIHCFGRRDNQVKLRGQRIELVEIEKLIGTILEIQSTVVLLIKTDQVEAICATFSTRNQSDHKTATILKLENQTTDLVLRLDDLLRAHLPRYAVPRYWVPLSKIPSDTNHKLDRLSVRNTISALSKDELGCFTLERRHTYVVGKPLESEKEKKLGVCFGEVLGTTELFKGSNFFNLSGDSITAIRLCSLASYHGLRLVISDIYQNPTLEQLAHVARETQAPEISSAKKSIGIVHNTPIMEWFFSQQKKNPDWYNQTVLIKLKALQYLKKLPTAWKTIIQTHPSLRIRSLNGSDQVELLDPSRTDNFLIRKMQFVSFDALLDGIVDVASGLCLATGLISSLGLFEYAGEGYCAFCVHHLAIDIVSWQIIFDNLGRLLRGESILPEFGTFQDWSLRLRQRQLEASKSPSPRSIEVASDQRHVNFELAPNFVHKAHLNTVSTARMIELKEPQALTNFLLTDANRNIGSEPVDILLASLLWAFQRWKAPGQVEICFESHGRDLKDDFLDTSRTVGWFTSMTDILFSIPTSTEMQLDELIAEVKDCRSSAMRKVDLSRQFTSHYSKVPVITFNYHGSYSTNPEGDDFIIIDIGESRADEDPSNLRFATIDIGCGIVNGVLTMNIIYSTSIHEQSEASGLLQLWSDSLKDFLNHCKRGTTKCILTNRELPSLLLERHQIAALVRSSLAPVGIEPSMIENIVVGTDMQKSMVLASQEYGSYIESFLYDVRGTLDLDLFIVAWSKVVAKHAALRSVFIKCGVADTALRGEIFQVIMSPDHSLSACTIGPYRPSPLRFDYGRPTMQNHITQVSESSFLFTWEYHHALVDGWSAGIVMRDFESAYLARLSPAVVSFENVRSKMKDSVRDERTRKFWESELDGALQNHLLDYSQPRNSQDGNPLNWRYEKNLAGSSQHNIESCAITQSTTVSTILRAAWALALAYFYGEEEVIFGATTSGRNIDVPGIMEVVGPCVNTVPFRIRLDGLDSKESYLRQVHLKSASLVENDGISLHQIYEISRKKDLFDTTFVYQNYAKFSTTSGLPFTIELLKAHETTDIPLNVMVGQSESGQLHVSALLHGEQLSSAFADSLFTAFATALAWICSLDNKGTKIRDLVMLGPVAQRHMEDISCGPTLQHPNLTIWQLFADQESQISEKPALEFYTKAKIETFSYKNLLISAEHGARYLHMRGTRSGDKVALYMDKSPVMIFMMLSLFRLGATCIPLRFDSPDERIELLMQEATPKLIILFEKHAKRISASRNLIHAENILEWEALDSTPLPAFSYTADDPAMILFTSGTTGVPKGVVMPNRQVVGYAVTMAKAYRYDQNSRIFSFASYTFDVFISDFFGGLSAGATLCFTPQTATMDDLAGLLNVTRSTHINLTSSVASMLNSHELPHLQSLVLTGEPATKMLLQTWASRIHVINCYGPTEAAVITWCDVSPDSDPRCVGQVVSGMEVMILDASLRRVPIGVQGNIYTCGSQLSLGYLDRPELTRELFVANPYSQGKLMYNTGDLGAFDSKGRILLLGRKDRQVKIHGQRLDLGEVEVALGHHDRLVVMTVFNPAVNQTRVIAFFEFEPTVENVLDGNISRSAEARNIARKLEKRARWKLPSYMVPSALIPIQKFPLTTNGKIDQANLQAIFLNDYLLHVSREDISTQSIEPMSATESQLCKTIAEMFGISSVSVNVDLFNSVLDSLSSMSLAAHLRTVFKRPIRLHWILESRNIRDLAFKIDSYNSTEHGNQEDLLIEYDLQTPPTISFSSSTGQNIFCIHPASGLSYLFHKLASHLRGLNVIGVNDPHYGDSNAYQDIYEMADLYLKSIIKHQSSGHFVLLGYSFGAHVATEIARLLHERGHTVLLILVDSSVERSALDKFKSPEIAASVLKSFNLQIEKTARTDEKQDFLEKLQREVARNLRLMTQYQMQYFPWQITFLRACNDLDDEKRCGRDVANGYGDLVKDLVVERIAGDHYDVFEDEHISFTSAVIGKILRRYEGP